MGIFATFSSSAGRFNNAFQRKPHTLLSECYGCFGLVSLKKVLVITHWNSISSGESRFFLGYTVKKPKCRRAWRASPSPEYPVRRGRGVGGANSEEAAVPAQTARLGYPAAL